MHPTLTVHPGTLDDLDAAYDVFVRATADLERRVGTPDDANVWLDPSFAARYWERRRPLFVHLSRPGGAFWVAEVDGAMVGYARSTRHEGLRELNEFFVHPGHQGHGIGRELIARAFPRGGTGRRAIIASTDIRALTRYLKAGVYPRFPIYAVSRKPEPVTVETDLTFTTPVAAGGGAATPDTLAVLRAIDGVVLGFARDADHAFLSRDRPPTLYHRDGRVVGYGYTGTDTGPIALFDPADFPAVLARAESDAAARGDATFSLSLPLINRAAVDYLLSRGFRLDDFTILFMSDEPFGHFDRYIVSTPDFFI